MVDLEYLKSKKRFAWLKDEEIEYLQTEFPWCNTMQEAVFCLKENISEQPKCQYENCIENSTFMPRKGYNKGCCKSHTTKLNNLEKYGVENVKQHKEFIEKAKETYHSKSDEEKRNIQKKKEESMLKKYGVKNPSYSDKVKNKISKKNRENAATRMIQLKRNNQEKYGVDNVFQIEEVKKKSKITLKQKLGVENPSQSDEIKLKKEKTCLENFGVNFPVHDSDIFEKQQKHRWKDYTMPSGKIVKIQGYEHFALDILLEKYSESELIIERKKIPKIKYGENKHKQYTTDIFIPKENKMIEVKSPYTFKKYLELNLLKEKASIDAGYNFEFMILDEKRNIIQKDDILDNL